VEPALIGHSKRILHDAKKQGATQPAMVPAFIILHPLVLSSAGDSDVAPSYHAEIGSADATSHYWLCELDLVGHFTGSGTVLSCL
jgi:hypothetical protein